jgi:hypothetical protein
MEPMVQGAEHEIMAKAIAPQVRYLRLMSEGTISSAQNFTIPIGVAPTRLFGAVSFT